MFAATSPYEPTIKPVRAQRASGTGRVSFKPGSMGTTGKTMLDGLYQQGCAKIRLPRVYGSNGAEAVLINSSGGLTGGDDLNWDVSCGTGTAAVATTQACEKIYKSNEGPAQVSTNLTVADGARLDWLPQETILFDQSQLTRNLLVDLSGTARFLAVESVLLGRLAMGEKVHSVGFSDNWRIRRDGQLLHADTLTLNGNVTGFGANAAVLSSHSSFSSLCYIGPEDTESLATLADGARQCIARQPDCHGGVSAFNGKLLVRLSAPYGLQLRAALIPLIQHLRAGEPLPRVWTT
ncbi:urease accessory protein [Cohaesibacter celericrescens]|uniref:Urease accessory protein UreD n=2 Tax=Cohaesibacter celericrescens TaxID=2067669 RepID=A0A2N5XUQ1_9HYPH|nr:urease accessory protein [Cohaesibacter celericrescens]